jgi:hypothetical protein
MRQLIILFIKQLSFEGRIVKRKDILGFKVSKMPRQGEGWISNLILA